MKKHKSIIAFIILLLLLAIFLGITLYSSILSYMEVSSQADVKVNGMIDTLNRVQDRITDLEAEYREKTESSMELMCTALAPYVKGDSYEGPEFFEDGVVIRVENGNVIYPESFSGSFELTDPDDDLGHLPLMTHATLIDEPDKTRPVLISARQIDGNFYYIDWWEMDDYESTVNYRKNIGEAVTTLEKLYDANLLLISESDDDVNIIYASKDLGSPESIKDLGITSDDIASESGNLTIGKNLYSATYEDLQIFDRKAKAIVLLNPIDSNNYVINCIIISAGFIFLCMTGFILWLHWIDIYIKDHEPTENQIKAWKTSQLQKRAISIGMNGAILLFCILIGYQLLGNLSRISNSNQESLDIMMARLENSSIWVSHAKSEVEDWGTYYAKRIADLFSWSPELRNVDFLKKANELIGSEYIMIFDGKGKELLSSNGYVGFTLGDGIHSCEEFRFLLQGIETIIHEPEWDQFSGKTLQMMGVKMDLGENDSYGAVILTTDPEITWESTERQDISNYIRMLTHQENISFIIDQESGKVIYSSEADLIGKEPSEFGLNETDLLPVSLETFEVQGVKRYGAFNQNDRYRAYFMTDTDYLWGDSVKFSIFSALSYLLICLVISIFLLGPSRVNKEDITEDTERLKEKLKQKPNFSLDQETVNALQEEGKGDLSWKEWWHDLTPEQKISKVIKITVTVIFILLFILLTNSKGYGSNSVTGFVMDGNWKRGFNELAVIAIICILIMLCAFILLKDFLVRFLFSMLNPKGRTIVGLISSLLQYIAIISAVFVSLAYLGFDPSVLITTASILTLAISLGSKDLVADILSGIFIIFEGDFHVGDIIEVNGFKGRVLDIGVRSTKLKDSGNNIKIIDNQSVKNVLNMSKDTSWVYVTLTISNTQPLEEIEAMLDRELPKIGEKIPKIVSGPFYFGIDSIDYHRLRITIAAVCEQSDINKIKPYLNHYLWEAFRDNGFQL